MHPSLSPCFTSESVFQSMRTLLRRVLQTLKNNMQNLPKSVQEEASFVLQSEQKILNSLQKFVSRKFSAMRIRIHGDYHLGQVLYTGKDFIIIDFEGEPARELTERRLKHSPFKDVAGMVRSFHYAVYTALFKEASVRPEDAPLLSRGRISGTDMCPRSFSNRTSTRSRICPLFRVIKKSWKSC